MARAFSLHVVIYPIPIRLDKIVIRLLVIYASLHRSSFIPSVLTVIFHIKIRNTILRDLKLLLAKKTNLCFLQCGV